MQDDKSRQPQQEEQTGEPNPTLGQPGSQVADYGNPMGGSATDAASSQHSERQGQNEARGTDGESTLGNP